MRALSRAHLYSDSAVYIGVFFSVQVVKRQLHAGRFHLQMSYEIAACAQERVRESSVAERDACTRRGV